MSYHVCADLAYLYAGDLAPDVEFTGKDRQSFVGTPSSYCERPSLGQYGTKTECSR